MPELTSDEVGSSAYVSSIYPMNIQKWQSYIQVSNTACYSSKSLLCRCFPPGQNLNPQGVFYICLNHI